uniref:Uncharacterized protein n=1 Tax=Fagus sylvatica TaxID=28930 RepID=A0A2N9ITK2_FAGSY
MQASVLPEHVLRLPRSNPPPLSSFSRGGYDRRDCVICGGFRGGLRGGLGFAWVSLPRSSFGCPDAAVWVSPGFRVGFAAQIRSQLSLCRPRSGLSWRGEGGAAPDPVSTGDAGWLTQWMDDPFHKQEYVMFSRLSYHNSVRLVVSTSLEAQHADQNNYTRVPRKVFAGCCNSSICKRVAACRLRSIN